MIGDSFLPLGRAARCIVAAGLFVSVTLPALAQDDQSNPPPPADQAAPPAETPAAPAEATPAPATAPETTATVPVQPLTPEQAPAPVAKEATQLESIEVTGSRLKRSDYETAQPVVSISREDIERSGLTDINDILRHLAIAGNNTVTPAFNRDFLSLGEANLDLRNLGAQHTLLLVNGRRWITGLVQTQPNIADFNTIPTAIIERIEILKDGASAIYGSDAIGGVVNIITRKDYQGVGVEYNVGNYVQQGDGLNQQASLSWGATHPGSSFFLNLSYTDQGLTYAKNRKFTESPVPEAGFSRWSTNTDRGRWAFFPTPANAQLYSCPNLQGPLAAGELAGTPAAGVGPTVTGTKTIPAGLQLCTLQLIPGQPGGNPTDYRQTQELNPEDHYNRFQKESLTQPNTRTALFTQYTQNFGEHMNFAFEGLYNIRDSKGLTPNLTFNGGDLGMLYTATNIDGITTDNPSNPFGQGIGYSNTHTLGEPGYGAWTMRMLSDLSNPTYHQKVHTLRLAGALRGDFEVFGLPTSWDTGYIYGRNKIQEILPLQRFDRTMQVLGERWDPSTDTSTYDPTVCQAPCPGIIDVFHGQAGFNENFAAWTYYDTWQRNHNGQDIVYGDLSGEVPQLSQWLAAPLAVAVGAEIRRDVYGSDMDPVFLNGDLVNYNKQQSFPQASNLAREAYVELGIPLLKDLPFVHALDLDLAARYSHYAGFGNIQTGKAGVRYQPLDDLLLRGTYSTGFRAPSLAELHLPSTVSGDAIADPCADPQKTQQTTTNCAMDNAATATGQTTSPYGNWFGDPNLKPEKSVNVTYGFVYSPHFIPDLNLGVDYYKIKIDQYIIIGGIEDQYFLDSCYKQATRNYCQYANHRDNSGELLFVDVPFFNLGKTETEGVDFDADYVIPTPEILGRFKFTLNTSYVTAFNNFIPQPGQADVVQGLVGQATGLFTSLPRWKAGTELLWKREIWSASWSTHLAYHLNEPCTDIIYTPSYKDLGLCSDPKVDASGNDISENRLKTVVYHNLRVGREFPSWNADISIGLDNVLDQDPPRSRSLMGSVFGFNYDQTNYEIPGRRGYLQVNMKF